MSVLLAIHWMNVLAITEADLQRMVEDVTKQYRLPGAYAALTSADDLLAQVGVGDFRLTDVPPYLRIGSVTKLFNGLLVLRLVQAAQLTLDTPCSTRLLGCPQELLGASKSEPTVAHLLEHTSGMSDLLPSEFGLTTPHPLEQVLSLAPRSRAQHWPTGQFFVYSNNNAAALSVLLQTLVGVPYETLMSRNVLQPLQLRSATFAASPEILHALAPGHDADGRTRLPYWHMPYPAMGALNIKADDLLSVVRLLLNRGRQHQQTFLSPPLIARMETPTTALNRRHGVSCGYGLGVYCWYRNGIKFFGHDGDADGYLTHLAYSSELASGYVIAINSFNREAMRALRTHIETALAATHPRTAIAVYLPTPAERASLSGTYTLATSRFRPRRDPPRTMRVYEHDGKLWTTARREPVQLISVAPAKFRMAEEREATIARVELGSDVYLLGDDLGNWRKIVP